MPATVAVPHGTSAHIEGDSITLGIGQLVQGLPYGGPWWSEPGGLQDQMLAAQGPATHGPIYGGVPQSGSSMCIAQGGSRLSIALGHNLSIQFTGHGVGGRTSAGFLADLVAGTSAVLAQSPSLLFLEFGTNDFGTGVDPTVFASNMAQSLDRIHVANPSCQIVVLSPPICHETWTAVGPHLLDGLDTWGGIAQLQAVVAARSSWCTFADVTTDGMLHEVANNTPAPGADPFDSTIDSKHPTSAGKVRLGTSTMKVLTFP